MKTIYSLAVALALAASTLSSSAAPLPSASVLVPVPGEAAPVGGSVVTSVTSAFSVPGSFSGILTSEAIMGDTSNPLGGLTFTYQFTNTSSGLNSIGRMSIDHYLGWGIDASYDTASLGIVPALIDRNPFGDVVGFSFFPFPMDPLTAFLTPGTSSRLLVLQTAAPDYRPATASFIDGGVTTAPTIAPAVVPEPASVILALLGSGIAIVLGRRRAL